MIRRAVAVLLVATAAWALTGDALGPFVSSGAPLSASALRAALDARSEAVADVREQVIDVRRTQIAQRDRVAFLEQSVAAASADGVVAGPLEAGDDPWTEAGIVAGQVADAEALNAVFERFVEDASNIRAFQGLLILDQDALLGRIAALEEVAGILDPPDAGLLAADEDEVSVPHAFAAGTPMRASEMNANLQAVDGAVAAEAAMAAAIAARQALLGTRIEALETELGPEPLFTWRIGTYDRVSGRSTESHFIFQRLGAFEPFTITVTGPEAYERSLEVTNAATRSTGWIDPLLPSGTYTAAATYGGVDFTLPIAYDATRVLPRSEVTLDTATTSTVAVTIGRVEATAVYDVRLIASAGPFITGTLLAPFAESTRTVEFTGLDLDPSATYYVFVATASVLDPWSLTMAPQQIDRGASTTETFTPSAP